MTEQEMQGTATTPPSTDGFPPPKAMLQQLGLWDALKSEAENLKDAVVDAMDSPLYKLAVLASIPLATPLYIMTAYQDHMSDYNDPKQVADLLKIAAKNPTALLSHMEPVQKLRIAYALNILSSDPEGQRLVTALEKADIPVTMKESPGSVGTFHWATRAGEDGSVQFVPKNVNARPYSTSGGLVSILAHELQHMRQAMNLVSHPAQTGNPISLEDTIINNRFLEADAQATATQIAWNLKQAGKPGAWNSLFSTVDAVGGAPEIAEAFQHKALADPESVANGGAKRAAFDAWFTTSVPEIYNVQGRNIHKSIEKDMPPEKFPPKPMGVEQLKRMGTLSNSNYLDIPGGRPLDDPYYRQSLDIAETIPFVNPDAPPPVPPIPAPDVPTAPVLPSRFMAVNQAVDSGMGVVGLVQGTMGAVTAAREGDATGVAVNGANAASGAASVAIGIAKAAGRQVAPALEATVGKANIALTVGTGLYHVVTEEGNFIETHANGSHSLGSRSDRTVETTVTAATGIGLAIAGAPAVVVVPAVVATALAGDAAVESRRTWREVERRIEENGRPERRDINPNGETGPSIYRYKHVAAAMMEVSGDIRTEQLAAPVTKGPEGRISLQEFRKLDMSDEKNLREFERALDINIRKQKKVMEENGSLLPNWVRSGEPVERHILAKMILTDLSAAKAEIAMFREELKPPASKFTAEPPARARGAAPPKPVNAPRGRGPGGMTP